MKDFFSKCGQICSFLRIWSHLLMKSLIENLIICAVHILSFQTLYGHYFAYFAKKNPEISEVKTRDFFNILIKSFHTKGQNFTQYKKV